ncbi:Uncharacterized protein conserved in archaea [Geoglobus ahangari]|uniref:Uncharacterized protein conserved in archaea n=1 Tax=Geoglobus ahangari TaxID=113653 RepID=A0A0F7ID16_9EURY|nr:DUF357 domain-containing protein [Geoglobus ahangari]AKG90797.1 Uncharacterized protein conserved in archaea [Geoglobus ahangari]
MSLESELRSETVKWLERIERLSFEGDRRFVENIKAYISDSHYFLEKGDLVRAFECVVWAWAWLEIGRDFGFLEVRE